MTHGLRPKIEALYPKLVDRRRDFHRHPELAYEEVRTAGIVAEWCRELGLAVETGIGQTGVIARLERGKGKRVALRADMDALPIQDAKSCDYKSTIPGKMHACGHDVHTTMLLGVASVLVSLGDALPGNVTFVFQPAEEGRGGALPMIAGGALDGVDLVLGQHMGPTHPTGVIAVSEGPAMAAADFFELEIVGDGGHGAYPHLARDPLPVAAEIVTALQTIVSRTVDPLASAVVTLGTIHGGFRNNVIAPSVVMTGTVRTFDPGLRLAVRDRVARLVRGITEAHGLTHRLDYTLNYPPTINHRQGVALVDATARDVLGEDGIRHIPPSMGGEDFAYYLEKKPGAFYWLGCRPREGAANIHHPEFDVDERAMVVGVEVMAEAALRFLEGGFLEDGVT
ncbi:MAG: amidohydrolase [Myxococcales bacterium]|nr:amidohydrolase [Myxococcales bacterium]